ncbi:MAG: RNA polymerase sigma factor RpoH [Gammaproteobacteria bacterium]|nr:RNA polymerase sigma factor RpoH [Gammaproteobacteria bacterium]RPG25340.1 MAG: RNA polymerase sigma factor RpoH [Gammaproteobacteria bacterium TMED50]
MTVVPAQVGTLPALSSSSLDSYIQVVGRIPALTREQEVALFERYQQEVDLDAVRQLVMSHLRYVVFIARGYAGYGLPVEDLIQQGNVGLMKSVKKFSLDHEVRLISFAVHWIKAEIHEYVLKNWKIVKVATTKAQRKLFFNLRKNKKRLGWFNQQEVDAVAETLGVARKDVLEMESRMSGMDESFDGPEDDEGESASPAAYLSAGTEVDPAWVSADDEVTDLRSQGLHEALTSLDERSRDIVESRWLVEPKTGLKELAAKYGVSMERIRQLEKKAFEKMQPYLAVDGESSVLTL